MGHAVGWLLRAHGLRVITNLAGRSARTRALAARAGIEDVGDDHRLVREADVLLSVLPPAQALPLAERVAAALKATGTDLLFVECNAIAPQTVQRIAATATAAGAQCVDAGIIGGPPRLAGLDRPAPPPAPPDPQASGATIVAPAPAAQGRVVGPRFYASGEAAPQFARLRDYGLDVRVIGTAIGQASGLKMCYAALTKGLTALATELLVAAERMGLSAALRAELEASQRTVLEWIERSVPGMPPKAYRWVGEMEEIAATFGTLGLTPRILEGAADLYRLVEQTELGQETPEARTRGTTLEAVVTLLARARSAAPADAADHRRPETRP
jgi:3-hydroxyisobutyrate dehydrogenase-like beta-hydroxyacid dehydrogenase